jgi:hypothetical protein
VLERDDDYDTPGKPPCDWDDAAAREALVDALVRDALAALAVLDGEALTGKAAEAAELLALVAGQDVAQGEDGVFRIVRGVARDRVISIVDPEARHGRKSQARRFDGYKTHVAIDPEDEIITEAVATPANTPDRDVVEDLVEDLLEDTDYDEDGEQGKRPVVVGDSAYADAATRTRLEAVGIGVVAKVPPARNSRGGFTKDAFAIDTAAGTVTCPANQTVSIRPSTRGGGRAVFGARCATCPLRAQCTSSSRGRIVTIHPHEATLQQAKVDQADPGWQARYRAARPVVERKIAHFTRRLWGGRQARCRGLERINTDVATRAGALNLARLATLGLGWGPHGWQLASP